jgi:hypothetical protein
MSTAIGADVTVCERIMAIMDWIDEPKQWKILSRVRGFNV